MVTGKNLKKDPENQRNITKLKIDGTKKDSHRCYSKKNVIWEED